MPPGRRKRSKSKTKRSTATRRKSNKRQKSMRRKRSSAKTTVINENNFGTNERYQPGKYIRNLSFGYYKRTRQPFLVSPHGPYKPWLVPRHQQEAPDSTRAPSSRFGKTLSDYDVNAAGYLSLWHGQPRTSPPSWNPLLLQDQSTFREGINEPTLGQVRY